MVERLLRRSKAGGVEAAACIPLYQISISDFDAGRSCSKVRKTGKVRRVGWGGDGSHRGVLFLSFRDILRPSVGRSYGYQWP